MTVNNILQSLPSNYLKDLNDYYHYIKSGVEIVSTGDLWVKQNNLFIICDSLRSSSNDMVGFFCQPLVISVVF